MDFDRLIKNIRETPLLVCFFLIRIFCISHFPSRAFLLLGLINPVFLLHFPLVTLGIQGSWSPDSYLFYNSFFMATLLLAIIKKDDIVIVHVCLVLNGFGIFFDILVLIVYFPDWSSYERFSAVMAIFNFFARTLTNMALINASDNLSSERGRAGQYEEVESD